MSDQLILQKLLLLEKLIIGQSLLQKSILNFKETCQYLQVSASHLYKLTSKKQIPHYCPEGKRLVFVREELDQWQKRNKQTPSDEIETQAANYIIQNKLKK